MSGLTAASVGFAAGGAALVAAPAVGLSEAKSCQPFYRQAASHKIRSQSTAE